VLAHPIASVGVIAFMLSLVDGNQRCGPHRFRSWRLSPDLTKVEPLYQRLLKTPLVGRNLTISVGQLFGSAISY
jgi:hypothetical protein